MRKNESSDGIYQRQRQILEDVEVQPHSGRGTITKLKLKGGLGAVQYSIV